MLALCLSVRHLTSSLDARLCYSLQAKAEFAMIDTIGFVYESNKWVFSNIHQREFNHECTTTRTYDPLSGGL
ncbi:hypothetical protein GGE29_004324 [Agrobacterium tumefaciens]|nr:hypothetical protein [Agrobacterium radiobacter]